MTNSFEGTYMDSTERLRGVMVGCEGPTSILQPAPEHCVPRWYAVYTAPRHEKRIAQQMEERRLLNFLPVYRSVRRWKDRKKILDLPLFPDTFSSTWPCEIIFKSCYYQASSNS